MLHVYTDAQKQFVRDNANIMKDVDVAASLSRISGRPVSIHAVRHLRHKLGIRKRRGKGFCEVLP